MGRYAIELEKPNGVYSAGETIRGNVLHAVSVAEDTLGITITCLGRSTVEFEIAVETSAHKFTSDETCFLEFIYLVGDPTTGEITTLEPGTHSYPFLFQLPIKIPSTLIGDGGRVTYVLDVTNRKFGGEERLQRTLKIIGVLNLNSIPAAAAVRDVRLKKYACCWCCRSGPIGTTLIINKSGFVPGESIKIIGEIYNFSKRTVKGVKVTLVRIGVYRAKKTQTTSSTVVMEYWLDGVGPRETRSLHECTEPVPNTPPTELGDKCSNIFVVYKILVDMIISKSRNLHGEIPNIYIGTVPLISRPTQVQIIM